MKVTLRPLQEADAKTSVHWRNDPEIWRYTKSRPDRTITLDDELNWIRAVTKDPTCRRFAIRADAAYVGNIYLTGIKDGHAEYHIFIGNRAYWGKGVARQASEQIIAFAKDKLKLRAIELAVHQANTGAVKLYKSLGFAVIGQDGDFIQMKLAL